MNIQEKALILRNIGHPVRLEILMLLAGQCVCVKEMWQRLALPQAIVSQHLRVLKENGIVSTKRNGTQICYSIRPEVMAEVCELFCFLHGKDPTPSPTQS